MNEFSELNVKPEVIEALEKIDIFSPTPIQSASIPLLLEGYDVIGQAQTGSGKTFAYAIPLLDKLDENSKDVQALVLCPTRELSLQVAKEIDKLCCNLKKIKTATIYGGESYEKQLKALKNKPQVIIGTPGRIIDQMNRGNLSFKNIKYLVLDEADEMLKMGFQEDLETILVTMPTTRQTALFSATMPAFIKNVAKNYMIEPKNVKIESKALTVEGVYQQLYYVKREQKKDLLVRILDYYTFNSVMIFANTKAMVDELVLFLQEKGFSADGLHGDLKQGVRDRVMQSFRLSSVDILIATDVAARGIDIDDIDAVINFDLPQENEIYVHRIGRTARAGNTGTAISLATTREAHRVAEIEGYIKEKINVKEIPTVKEIHTHYQKSLYLKLLDGISENKDNHDYDNLLNKLSKECSDPVPLLVTLIKMLDTDERNYPAIDTVSPRSKRETKSKPDMKGRSVKPLGIEPPKAFTVVEFDLGEIDKIRPNQLVCFFHDELKIHREHFGKIVVDKKYSYVEVNEPALKYLKDLKYKKFNGRQINYRIIDNKNVNKPTSNRKTPAKRGN